jgi:hypothetical protein
MTLLQKIGHFISNIFHKVHDIAEDILPKAIEVVNNFKTFDTNHPEVIDVLTAIIPGTWDDAIKAKLRSSLPQILAQMQIIKDDINLPLDEFVQACLDKIKALDKTGQGYKYFELAGRLALDLADGKLTDEEIKSLLQAFYDQLKAQQEQSA